MTKEAEFQRALELGFLVPQDDEPGTYWISDDYYSAMDSLSDAELEAILNKANGDDIETLTGMATLGVIKWKGVINEDDISLGVRIVIGLYKRNREGRMQEFLAKLRLGERVKK